MRLGQEFAGLHGVEYFKSLRINALPASLIDSNIISRALAQRRPRSVQTKSSV